MTRLSLFALAMTATLGLPACKIVKTTPEGQASAAAGTEAGDDARIAKLADDTLSSQLLPLVDKAALPVAELRGALAQGSTRPGPPMAIAARAKARRGTLPSRGRAWWWRRT